MRFRFVETGNNKPNLSNRMDNNVQSELSDSEDERHLEDEKTEETSSVVKGQDEVADRSMLQCIGCCLLIIIVVFTILALVIALDAEKST